MSARVSECDIRSDIFFRQRPPAILSMEEDENGLLVLAEKIAQSSTDEGLDKSGETSQESEAFSQDINLDEALMGNLSDISGISESEEISNPADSKHSTPEDNSSMELPNTIPEDSDLTTPPLRRKKSNRRMLGTPIYSLPRPKDRYRQIVLDKDLQIQALKAQRSLEIQRVREEERNAAELQMRARIAAIQTQHEEVIKDLQKRSKEKEDRALRKAREPTKDIKQSLDNLIVSESLYLQYKSVPESLRSVRQHVCIQVYQIVNSLHRSLDNATSQTGILESDVVKLETERDNLRRQVKALEEERKAITRDYTHEYKNLNTEISVLEGRLKKSEQVAVEFQQKAEQYNVILGKLETEKEKLQKLQQENLILNVSAKASEEDAREAKHRSAEFEQQVELLRQDKMYLAKEVEGLKENLGDSKEERSRLRDKVASLKKKREDLMDKLSQVHQDFKNSYQERLDLELKRIEEKTTGEIHSIRIQQKDLHDREIKNLRDERDSQTLELDRLRTRLQTTEKDMECVKDAHTKLSIEYSQREQTLRASLKLKEFELERLGISHEETLSSLRKAKLQAEMQQGKNEVLKTEFYSLKAESGHIEAKLRGELEKAELRIKSFEDLESDIDMAVLTSGAGEIDRALTEGGVVRSSAERRMQQALKLARKLMEKQKEVQVLLDENQDLKQTINKQNEERACLRKQLDLVSQPHNYLVSTIQARDQMFSDEKDRNQKLQYHVASLESEVASLRRDNQRMRKDIKTVLLESAGYNKLKGLVAGLKARKGRGSEVAELEKVLRTIPQPADPMPTNRKKGFPEYQRIHHPRSIEDPPPAIAHPFWAQKLRSKMKR
ncbi:hypothetical protein AAMO2058_000421700 [Amorphochlora amoebiformis]